VSCSETSGSINSKRRKAVALIEQIGMSQIGKQVFVPMLDSSSKEYMWWLIHIIPNEPRDQGVICGGFASSRTMAAQTIRDLEVEIRSRSGSADVDFDSDIIITPEHLQPVMMFDVTITRSVQSILEFEEEGKDADEVEAEIKRKFEAGDYELDGGWEENNTSLEEIAVQDQ
jgi:hypothetical protein